MYSDLEPYELPYELIMLLDWCAFFSYVEETLALYSDIPKPPRRITRVPEAFNKWVRFAREFDTNKAKSNIVPFGTIYNSEEEYYDTWGSCQREISQ